MNLPNTITVARLLLTAGFICSVSIQVKWSQEIALILFLIAALSDFLDGWLARKLNLETALGKLLDPLADKILVCSAFVYLSAEGICPFWITALILSREFLVTGLRQIAIEAGHVLAADRLGKWKTSFQLVYLISSLLFLTRTSTEDAISSMLDMMIMPVSLLLAVSLTLISGWNYVWSSRKLFTH